MKYSVFLILTLLMSTDIAAQDLPLKPWIPPVVHRVPPEMLSIGGPAMTLPTFCSESVQESKERLTFFCRYELTEASIVVAEKAGLYIKEIWEEHTLVSGEKVSFSNEPSKNVYDAEILVIRPDLSKMSYQQAEKMPLQIDKSQSARGINFRLSQVKSDRSLMYVVSIWNLTNMSGIPTLLVDVDQDGKKVTYALELIKSEEIKDYDEIYSDDKMELARYKANKRTDRLTKRSSGIKMLKKGRLWAGG